jgi:hypothetical protein
MPRWLSHRSLLLLETVLVVGLVKEALEWLVLERLPLDPTLRVLLGMAVVVGTLGGLLVVVQQRVRQTLERAHQAFKRRYRALPVAGLHSLLLVAIFAAYAAFWNEETGAWDHASAQVRAWLPNDHLDR